MRNSGIISFIIVLSFLLYSGNISAQFIKGALITGINFSQVDGDEVWGYRKKGCNLGAAAYIPFKNRKWNIGIETLYNQKGAREGVRYDNDTANGSYTLRLNYLEVPVLIHYEDKETWQFGIGGSWGRLVSAKEWEHGQRTNTDRLSPYSRDDFNILLDIRFRLIYNIKFNFRYAYSLGSIRHRKYEDNNGNKWERDQYNNVFSFRLVYMFNEKPPPPPERRKKRKKKKNK